MPSCCSASSLPVRPSPVWISSRIKITSCAVQSSRPVAQVFFEQMFSTLCGQGACQPATYMMPERNTKTRDYSGLGQSGEGQGVAGRQGICRNPKVGENTQRSTAALQSKACRNSSPSRIPTRQRGRQPGGLLGVCATTGSFPSSPAVAYILGFGSEGNHKV
jgi:hypothetical protein